MVLQYFGQLTNTHSYELFCAKLKNKLKRHYVKWASIFQEYYEALAQWKNKLEEVRTLRKTFTSVQKL